jgi:hypothetical protein
MKTAFCCLLISALFVSGCHNSTAPTTTPAAPYFSNDVFFGTLSPQGTQFRGLDVLQPASVTLTLVGLATPGSNATLSTPITLLLGTLSGDACIGSTTVAATPALTAHLTQELGTGGYCVSVSDAGGLTGDADFSVRIVQTANVDPIGQAGTETFSSNLYPGSTDVRTFATAQRGDVLVKLLNVSPARAVNFGLGVTSDGANCFVHKAVVSTPGSPAEISATADAGSYCVKVTDPGGLANRVTFNIEIRHP